jgi:asparagine synthase (glutamine-hydrolysing)
VTAVCVLLGVWARARDAAAHLAALLRALARPGAGEVAAWQDPSGGCRLGVVGRGGTPERPRVLEHGDLVAVCDGRWFDGGTVDQAGERLLLLWRSAGPRSVAAADTHFAIAVWDRSARRLTLARDALGVRSLYFHEGRGGVVFASTIEALLCHPAVPRDVDLGSVAQFLTFLSVPVPRTLFTGISKLPPGSAAICGPRGVERVERCWDLLDDPAPEVNDLDHYVTGVRRLFRDAVAGRVADGPPVAALLSGGNDSSANVALIRRLGHAPLHTFTVGLAELEGRDGFSDLVHARRVADVVGTTHHERLISVDDFIAAMPRVIDAQDDLVSEPSSVFLHTALDMIRERGLHVVITGEANDEISCGHRDMIHVRDGYYWRWRPLMALPRPARRLLARMAPVVSPRHSEVLARAAEDGEYFWSYEIGWTDHAKAEILTPDALAVARAAPASAIVAERARALRRTVAHRDYLAHVIGIMMQDYYLGNLMLGKLEQLSSRLGLDARCPYASPAYVRFVYNIPARFKARDGEVKAFFKKSIGDLLPHDIVYRPKQGFRTPTPELFRGRFGKWAEPLLLETGLTRTGVLRRDAVAGLLAQHRRGERDVSTRLWTALVLNLWHDRWIAPSLGGTRVSA